MKPEDSGWRYYLPDNGETSADAEIIWVYHGKNISDAERAAREASYDEWEERGGHKVGTGPGPDIIVIAPDGTETRFLVERLSEIILHNVYPASARA